MPGLRTCGQSWRNGCRSSPSRSMADPIAADEVLRRGILLRDLYWDEQQQEGRIARQAFLLRLRDQGELSVFRAALESPEKTFERLQRSEALAELITGDVRQ